MNGALSVSDELDATQNGFTATLLGSGGAASTYGGIGSARNLTHASGDSSAFMVGLSGSFFALHMHDANNGLAAGMGGLVMKTTDGGATWSAQPSSVSRNSISQLRLFGMTCPTLNTCYAVGGEGLPSNFVTPRYVMKTTDGGTNWSRIDLNASQASWTSISCLSDTACVLTGGPNYFGSLQSAGTSAATNAAVGNSKNGSYCVPGTSTCYLVGGTASARSIHRVTHLGGVWTATSVLSATANQLLGVHCPTVDICYAVGVGGAILKSTDASTLSTWNAQISGTTKNLYGIHCLNALTCVAVGTAIPWTDGDVSVILRTTDGGSTWTNKSVAGFNDSLYAVKLTGSGTGIIVGGNGTVLRTLDGGDTWTLNANSRKLAFATNGAYDYTSGTAGSGKGDNYSMSSWVRVNTGTYGTNKGQMFIVGKGDDHWVMQTYPDDQFGMAERNWMACGSVPATACTFPTGNSTAHSITVGGTPTVAWHHVIGVRINNATGGAYAANVDSFFIDGGTKCGGSQVVGLNAPGGVPGLTMAIRGYLDIVAIGRNTSTYTHFWKRGPLDEIRLDARNRSADWACLSYQTQTPDTAAYYGKVVMGSPVNLRSADRRGANAFNLTGAGEYVFTIPEEVLNSLTGAELRVVDVSGRTVWSSFVRPGETGGAIRWNGRDAAGHRVKAGVYFARLKTIGEGKGREYALRASLTR
jgi:photosystem II stability/assembly factor-like uncharacterized protein